MSKQMRKAVLHGHGHRRRQPVPYARAAGAASDDDAPRASAHALDVRGQLQVHVHARAHGPSGGERGADGAVLRQVAVLAVRGHAGARVGRVLRCQLAHARPRRGLAPPRRASLAPDAALLSYLGLREHQRVGLVGRVSHPWCVSITLVSLHFPLRPLQQQPPFHLIPFFVHTIHPPWALLRSALFGNHPFVPSDDGQETCFQLTDLPRALGASRICIQTRH